MLLVKDFSRLGRRLHFVGNLGENVLPSLNVRLISLSDNYDSLTYKDNESIVLKKLLK
ncbi:MAG: hypothetical protein R3Y05_06430 [bacterium]